MAALSPTGLPSREALRDFARSYRASQTVIEGTASQGGAGCTVTVGAYTSTRNGKPEQVSGYQRSNPHCGDTGDGGVVLAADRSAPRSTSTDRRPPAPTRAWEGQPNQSWREQIAAEETRRDDGDFGYGMRGQQPGSTALGRYQVLRDPLIDAGWRDRVTGAWTARARAAGIASDADFLANPAAQEAALNDVMRRNEEQLRANGAMRFLGQQVSGLRGGPVPVTEAGLAAAAHREGAGAVSALSCAPRRKPAAAGFCEGARRPLQFQRDRTTPPGLRRDALPSRAAMKRISIVILCPLIAASLPPAFAAERRLPWESMPPVVSDALHALRQTDHWLAEAMSENLDGDRLGRDNPIGRSFNFDPSRHLLFSLHDLNGDGRQEVFLLFPWPYVRGNQQAAGIVMVQARHGEWHIGCQISDWGDEGLRGGIRVLDARSHGWRNFRTSDALYAWRPVAGQAEAMECVPIASAPTRRQGRAAP
jgi:hypothetical protein